MRIIFNELKKTFRPIVLLTIILIFGMFYLARFEVYVGDFYQTRLAINFRYQYSQDLINRYGPTLEPEEFEGVIADYNDMCNQLDNYIASNEIFTSNNVYSYSDYENFINMDTSNMDQAELDMREQANRDMFDLLYSDDCEWLTKKIIDLEEIIRDYNENYSSETSSILPSNVTDLLAYEMFSTIFVLLVICVSITVAPMPVIDNLNKIHPLQYHTHIGRKTPVYQLISTIITAWTVCAAVLAVIFLLFLPTGVFKFLNTPLKSFMQLPYWNDYMFDFTLGQHIMLLLGFGLLFVTGVAMIIFFLAQTSSNYISLILKVIPVTVVTCVLGYFAADNAFHMMFDPNTGEPLGRYNMNLITFTAIVFVIGTALAIITITREKKSDLKD